MPPAPLDAPVPPDAGGDRCQALRDRAHVLRRQEAALERHLEGGLREECRRNGWLPGWIRG
jgi:hypothetical protein